MPLLSRVRALFRTRSPPFQVPECYDCHAGDRGSRRWPGGWRWAGPRSACARWACARRRRAGPPSPGGCADIAAQPLDAALAAYAQTTGMAVLVASRVTAGRRAAAVQGWYAPQDALSRLLAGTGLQARYSSATAFTLVEPAASRPGRTAIVRRRCRWPTRACCSAPSRARCVSGAARSSAGTGPRCSSGSAATASAAAPLAGTGDARRDAALTGLMTGLVMDAPPPAGLPQPVLIRLAPRADAAADCRHAAGG